MDSNVISTTLKKLTRFKRLQSLDRVNVEVLFSKLILELHENAEAVRGLEMAEGVGFELEMGNEVGFDGFVSFWTFLANEIE